MTASPNVLVRIQFYARDAKERRFYASDASGQDYLDYVDTGVRSTHPKDYTDYAGNPEKSAGVFDSQGLMDDASKQKTRDELRTTGSVIWDMVISLSEEYGKGKLRDWKEAKDLLDSQLPPFLRNAGFSPKAMGWFAGLHENTDNRHIHVCLYERYPTRFDKEGNKPLWHRGKIRKKAIAAFKVSIERQLDSKEFAIQGDLREVRDSVAKAREEIDHTASSDLALRKELRNLYSILPERKAGYGNRVLKRHRKDIDRCVTALIASDPELKKTFDKAMRTLSREDEKIRASCERNHIDPSGFMQALAFSDDVYRRLGNIVIDHVYESRELEGFKSPRLSRDKRIRWTEKKRIGWLLSKTARLNERALSETNTCFDEFERTLREAERQIALEENGHEIQGD